MENIISSAFQKMRNFLNLAFNSVMFVILASYYFLNFILFAVIGFIVRTSLFMAKDLQAKFDRILKRWFLFLTTSFLGFYFGKAVTVYYDDNILRNNKSIIISNHLTYYDWWFSIFVLHYLGKYEDLRIILKAELEKIPIFSYFAKAFGFIFLKRSITEDKNVLIEKANSLNTLQKYSILIFPEGTILTERTLQNSKDFINKNNLTLNGIPMESSYTLLPKKTGFNILLEQTKNSIDGVINVTMFSNPFYKFPHEKITFSSLFLQRSLRKFSLNFILEHIATNKNLFFDDWMYKIFKKKDRALMKLHDNYLTGQNFGNDICHAFELSDERMVEIKLKTWSKRHMMYIVFFYISIISVCYQIIYGFNFCLCEFTGILFN